MEYYALHVKTRAEERYIALFNAAHSKLKITLSFPKRVILERRVGKEPLRREKPVFPGYVFAAISEKQTLSNCLNALRKTPYFFRFLPSNIDVMPLSGRNLEIALHFTHADGAVAGISRVHFNEKDRIVVDEGPLAGLEGNIIKVDKRKGRAKIKLDFYGESFTLDLSFEVIKTL